LFSGEAAMADAVAIEYGHRMFKVDSVGLGEHAVQQRQHLLVRVRSAPEKDDAWTSRISDQYQPWIVKVSRDNDSTVPAG
jgi:hypothetical protein